MCTTSREVWHIPTYRLLVLPSALPLPPFSSEDRPDLSVPTNHITFVGTNIHLNLKVGNYWLFILVLQTETKSTMDKLTVTTNVMDVSTDLVWLKSGGGEATASPLTTLLEWMWVVNRRQFLESIHKICINIIQKCSYHRGWQIPVTDHWPTVFLTNKNDYLHCSCQFVQLIWNWSLPQNWQVINHFSNYQVKWPIVSKCLGVE